MFLDALQEEHVEISDEAGSVYGVGFCAAQPGLNPRSARISTSSNQSITLFSVLWVNPLTLALSPKGARVRRFDAFDDRSVERVRFRVCDPLRTAGPTCDLISDGIDTIRGLDDGLRF